MVVLHPLSKSWWNYIAWKTGKWLYLWRTRKQWRKNIPFQNHDGTKLHCLKQEMAIFLKNKEIMNEIEKQGNNETKKSTGDVKFSVFPLLFPCSWDREQREVRNRCYHSWCIQQQEINFKSCTQNERELTYDIGTKDINRSLPKSETNLEVCYIIIYNMQ